MYLFLFKDACPLSPADGEDRSGATWASETDLSTKVPSGLYVLGSRGWGTRYERPTACGREQASRGTGEGLRQTAAAWQYLGRGEAGAAKSQVREGVCR